jgi:hypothetical protein
MARAVSHSGAVDQNAIMMALLYRTQLLYGVQEIKSYKQKMSWGMMRGEFMVIPLQNIETQG